MTKNSPEILARGLQNCALPVGWMPPLAMWINSRSVSPASARIRKVANKMRTVFYLFSIGILVSFATWAYKVNYDTRLAERRVALLFDVLGLGPVAAEQGDAVTQVSFPDQDLEGNVLNAIMAIATEQDAQ